MDDNTLNKIKPGEKVKVIRLDNKDRQRLFDLGIVEGTKIEVLYTSPFGNPTAYLIRGTVFALRNETTEKIIVEKI